jgi:large subunit ribosomal protein L25
MTTIALTATARKITGKKVKKVRREGLLPAGLYGKGVTSLSLSVPLKEFLQAYAKTGETGLVEVKCAGKNYHTLIAHVQLHPVTRQPLHAQFHAVSLTEKIKAHVPVILVGKSPAVAAGTGILLPALHEVEVEALPADLPEKLAVEVEKLTEVGQQVTVGDLSVPKGVDIVTSKEEIIVTLAPAVSEAAKKEAEEAAKKAAEAAAASGAAAPAGAGAETPASPTEAAPSANKTTTEPPAK